MRNFISTFDELSKLYENDTKVEKANKKSNGANLAEGNDPYWRDKPYYDQSQKDRGVIKPYQKPAGYSGSQAEWERNCRDSAEDNRKLRRNPWEGLDDPTDGSNLTEAADDEDIEIVDEEVPEEDASVKDGAVDEQTEEEPRKLILECDSCGALVIKDESDIVTGGESETVNVEDECEFCEEAAGYSIIGVVAPYNPEDVDTITEDLGDWYRRKFDKPASVKTQQAWEDELNGECGEISDKRRKHLERKFLQQRDWEARHANDTAKPNEDDEELEELFDADINVSPNINLQANGNEVAVGGATV